MGIKLLCFLFLIIFQFSCKDNSTNPPSNNNPPGYQQDIPWPSLADTPWPMHRYNPQNTGRSPFSGPLGGVIEWSTAPYYQNNELVLDKENNVYALSCVGEVTLHKYNAGGTLLWEKVYGYANKAASTPLITSSGNIITADNNNIYSLSRDGDINWQFETGQSLFITGMSLDKEGNIYFTDASGTLYSLTPGGSLNWTLTDSRFYSNEEAGIAFSPDGFTLYMPGFDISLFAVDINTGSIKWFAEFGRVRVSPMVDSQGNIYVIARGEEDNDTLTFCSINPEGTERFIYKFTNQGTYWKIDPTIDKNGNLFFAGDSLFSLDHSGKLRWTVGLPGFNSSPLVNDKEGNIYLITIPNTLISVNNNGGINWSVQMGLNGNPGYSPVISSDNRLYVNILGSVTSGYPTLHSVK